MEKSKYLIYFFIINCLPINRAYAISSADIKEDNLAKFILRAYERLITEGEIKTYLVVVVVLLVLLGLLALYIWSEGLKNECPSCKKWNALYTTNTELLGQREGFKTVTRADDVEMSSSHYNSEHGHSSGSSSGTIYRKEQVRILEKTLKMHYKCRYCTATCSSTKITETENFFKT
jgi:hypothetical protein